MPVRFLFLVGQLKAGGAERQLHYLVRGLTHKHFETAVCVWNYEDDDVYVARLKALEVPVFALPRTGSRLQKLRAFRRIVQALRPDVVHSYSFFTNRAVYAGTWGTPALGIGSVRSDFLRDLAAAGRLNARWPRRQIFNSYNALENAERRKGFFVPRQRCVVRNGIDLAVFRPASGSSGSRVRVLGVGSLTPVKRWDRLITAAALLKAQGVDFGVQLVGDGVLRRELAAQMEASHLQDRVAFSGFLPDVAAVMQTADVLVHPSDTEGCPNVVMEAMACGVPVVLNRVGEGQYLVEDGVTGFLVEPGDDAALADRMRRLIQQPALRSRMGAQGRAVAEQFFGLDRFVDAMLAAYVELGWKGP